MRCPLTITRYKQLSVVEEVQAFDCLKEECGVWDKVLKQCVALSIGDWLENIHSVLSGMLDKMPHEKQFRR